jgi:hypothetical protein
MGVLLLAPASGAAAQPPQVRPACEAAGLAGRFYASSADGDSWTLLLEPSCAYASLRFSGDPQSDLRQPTRGVARLAQVDKREVVILQSEQGEFDEVMSVVRHRARVYLVPTNEHLRFCVEWVRGIEPRKGPVGNYLLRGGASESSARRELPELCRQAREGGD